MELKNYATKILRLQGFNTAALTLLASIYFLAVFNFSFWARLTKATGGINPNNFFLYAATFIMLAAAFNGFLTWTTFRPVLKPAFTFFLVTSSIATYFMDRYGILIDTSTVQSVFETDTYEASEFFSWRLVLTVLVLGVIPSIVLWRSKLPAPSISIKQSLLQKTKITLFSLAVAAIFLGMVYKPLTPIVRENRELRLLVSPMNYVKASYSYVKGKIAKSLPATPYGKDATRKAVFANNGKKSVTVIVVGESARAKNYSLNGYERDTNPMLSKQSGLISFTNVQSCDTSTSISLPCVFSGLGRKAIAKMRKTARTCWTY